MVEQSDGFALTADTQEERDLLRQRALRTQTRTGALPGQGSANTAEGVRGDVRSANLFEVRDDASGQSVVVEGSGTGVPEPQPDNPFVSDTASVLDDGSTGFEVFKFSDRGFATQDELGAEGADFEEMDNFLLEDGALRQAQSAEELQAGMDPNADEARAVNLFSGLSPYLSDDPSSWTNDDLYQAARRLEADTVSPGRGKAVNIGDTVLPNKTAADAQIGLLKSLFNDDDGFNVQTDLVPLLFGEKGQTPSALLSAAMAALTDPEVEAITYADIDNTVTRSQWMAADFIQKSFPDGLDQAMTSEVEGQTLAAFGARTAAFNAAVVADSLETNFGIEKGSMSEDDLRDVFDAARNAVPGMLSTYTADKVMSAEDVAGLVDSFEVKTESEEAAQELQDSLTGFAANVLQFNTSDSRPEIEAFIAEHERREDAGQAPIFSPDEYTALRAYQELEFVDTEGTDYSDEFAQTLAILEAGEVPESGLPYETPGIAVMDMLRRFNFEPDEQQTEILNKLGRHYAQEIGYDITDGTAIARLERLAVPTFEDGVAQNAFGEKIEAGGTLGRIGAAPGVVGTQGLSFLNAVGSGIGVGLSYAAEGGLRTLDSVTFQNMGEGEGRFARMYDMQADQTAFLQRNRREMEEWRDYLTPRLNAIERAQQGRSFLTSFDPEVGSKSFAAQVTDAIDGDTASNVVAMFVGGGVVRSAATGATKGATALATRLGLVGAMNSARAAASPAATAASARLAAMAGRAKMADSVLQSSQVGRGIQRAATAMGGYAARRGAELPGVVKAITPSIAFGAASSSAQIRNEIYAMDEATLTQLPYVQQLQASAPELSMEQVRESVARREALGNVGYSFAGGVLTAGVLGRSSTTLEDYFGRSLAQSTRQAINAQVRSELRRTARQSISRQALIRGGAEAAQEYGQEAITTAAGQVLRESAGGLLASAPQIASTAVTSPDAILSGVVGAIMGGGLGTGIGARTAVGEAAAAQSARIGEAAQFAQIRSKRSFEAAQKAQFEEFTSKRLAAAEVVQLLRTTDTGVDLTEQLAHLDNVTLLEALESVVSRPVEFGVDGDVRAQVASAPKEATSISFSSFVPEPQRTYYKMPSGTLPLYTELPEEGSMAVWQDTDGFYAGTAETTRPVRIADSKAQPVSLRHKDKRFKLSAQKGINPFTLRKADAVIRLAKTMGRTFDPDAVFPSVQLVNLPSQPGRLLVDSKPGLGSESVLVVTKQGMFISTAEGDLQVADAKGHIDPQLLPPEVQEVYGLTPESVAEIQSAIGQAIRSGEIDITTPGSTADILNNAENLMAQAREITMQAEVYDARIRAREASVDSDRSPLDAAPTTELGEVAEQMRSLNEAKTEVAAMKAEASVLASQGETLAANALSDHKRAQAARFETETMVEGSAKSQKRKSWQSKSSRVKPRDLNAADDIAESSDSEGTIEVYKARQEGYHRLSRSLRVASAYFSSRWVPAAFDGVISAAYRAATGRAFPTEYQSEHLRMEEERNNRNDMRLNSSLLDAAQQSIFGLERQLKLEQRRGLPSFKADVPETVAMEVNKAMEAYIALDKNELRGGRNLQQKSGDDDSALAEALAKRDALFDAAEQGLLDTKGLRAEVRKLVREDAALREALEASPWTGMTNTEAKARVAHLSPEMRKMMESFFDVNEQINLRIRRETEEAGVTNGIGRMIVDYEGPRYHLPLQDRRNTDDQHKLESQADLGITIDDGPSFRTPAVRSWKGFNLTAGRNKAAGDDALLFTNQVDALMRASRLKNSQNRLRGERAANAIIEATPNMTFEGKDILTEGGEGVRPMVFENEQTSELLAQGKVLEPKRGHSVLWVWTDGQRQAVTITDPDLALTYTPHTTRLYKSLLEFDNVVGGGLIKGRFSLKNITNLFARGFTQLAHKFWLTNYLRTSAHLPLRMFWNASQYLDQANIKTRRGREGRMARSIERARTASKVVVHAQYATWRHGRLMNEMRGMEPADRLKAAQRSKNDTVMTLAEYMNEVGDSESELSLLGQATSDRRVERFMRSSEPGLFERRAPQARQTAMDLLAKTGDAAQAVADATSAATRQIPVVGQDLSQQNILSGYAKLGRAAVTIPEMAHRAAFMKALRDEGMGKRRAIDIAQAQIDFNEQSAFSSLMSIVFPFARAGTSGAAASVRQSIFSAVEGGLPVAGYTSQGGNAEGRSVDQVRIGFDGGTAARKANYGALISMMAVGAGLQALRLSAWDQMFGEDDEVIEYDENGREVSRHPLSAIPLSSWLNREIIPGEKPGQVISLPLEYGEFTMAMAFGKAAALVHAGVVDWAEAAATLTRQTVPQHMGLVVGIPRLNGNFLNDFAANSVPQVIAPFTQLAVNQNFAGSPIYKEDTYDTGRAGHSYSFGSTAPVWKESAEALYEGTDGRVDTRPEVLGHVVRSYAVGFGPILDSMSKLMRDSNKAPGEELNMYQWLQHAGLAYDGSEYAYFRQRDAIIDPMRRTMTMYRTRKAQDAVVDEFGEDKAEKLQAIQGTLNMIESFRIPEGVNPSDYRQGQLDELQKLVQEYRAL